jgi:hypothetical protein
MPQFPSRCNSISGLALDPLGYPERGAGLTWLPRHAPCQARRYTEILLGRGYQTRINKLLRAAMEGQSRRRRA